MRLRVGGGAGLGGDVRARRPACAHSHLAPIPSQLALRLTVALDVDDLTAGWLATLESVALDATGAVDVRREEARGKRAPWAVVLPHASVSERHARLAFGGGRWSVTDVGSTNGTFLNYRQLKQGE